MLGDVIGTLNAVLRIFYLRKKVIKCSSLETDVTKFYPFFFGTKLVSIIFGSLPYFPH